MNISLKNSYELIDTANNLDNENKKNIINNAFEVLSKPMKLILLKYTDEILFELYKCLQDIDKILFNTIIFRYESEINSKNNKINDVRKFMSYFLNFYYDKYKNTQIEKNNDDDDNIQFEWRKNQIEAIENTIKNNFNSGIHSQATGAGKSLIALNIIAKYNEKYPTNAVMWLSERKDIPMKLFLDDNYKINKNNKKFWKDNNIIDLSKFVVKDFVVNKSDLITTWNKKYKKPLFIIINRAFLTTKSKNKKHKYVYQDIINNKPGLVIIDECHSAMANRTYNLLNYIKYNWNGKIQGFSATPYRKGKSYTSIDINLDLGNTFNTTKDIEIENNGEKLIKIFHKKNDVNTLNLISSFNLKEAIELGVILEPIFHWYSIENKKEEHSVEEIAAIMNSLNHVLKKCAYKKVIVWARLIELSENWKNQFDKEKKKYTNLKNLESFLSHSKYKNSLYDYNNFYNKKDNCIMFCANQFKEGSDIPFLTMGIFLDKVKNRGEIPFIQCIGRVLRKDNDNNIKSNGHILDGCVREDNMTNQIVNKIIKYYLELYDFSKSSIDDFKKDLPKNKLNMYNSLLKTLQIEPEKKLIKIKLKNDKNITINVADLDISYINWNTIMKKYKSEMKKILAFQLQEEYLEFKQNLIDLHIKNKKEYNKKWKQLGFINNNKKISPTDYHPYFKNWYDLLDIDTSNFIQTKDKWVLVCNKRNITWENYFNKCKKYTDLPDMPDEFYTNFTNIKSELSSNLVRNLKILI